MVSILQGLMVIGLYFQLASAIIMGRRLGLALGLYIEFLVVFRLIVEVCGYAIALT